MNPQLKTLVEKWSNRHKGDFAQLPWVEMGIERAYSECAKELAKVIQDPVAAANKMVWQPIETAPEDGTEMLVYSHGHIWIAYRCKKTGVWRDASDGRSISTPLYWMPLPPPPNVQGVPLADEKPPTKK